MHSYPFSWWSEGAASLHSVSKLGLKLLIAFNLTVLLLIYCTSLKSQPTLAEHLLETDFYCCLKYKAIRYRGTFVLIKNKRVKLQKIKEVKMLRTFLSLYKTLLLVIKLGKTIFTAS